METIQDFLDCVALPDSEFLKKERNECESFHYYVNECTQGKEGKRGKEKEMEW